MQATPNPPLICWSCLSTTTLLDLVSETLARGWTQRVTTHTSFRNILDTVFTFNNPDVMVSILKPFSTIYLPSTPNIQREPKTPIGLCQLQMKLLKLQNIYSNAGAFSQLMQTNCL